MRRLMIALLAPIVLLVFPAVLRAQRFQFGTDLVDDTERGRVNGGYATGVMDVVINGNVLTAILRNTSPDSENFGGDPQLSSPAITQFGFDLQGSDGGVLSLSNWELKAFDESGAEVSLGREGMFSWWRTTTADGSLVVKMSRLAEWFGMELYNPEASGGFAKARPSYFTQAVLTATFESPVNLIEHVAANFSPVVRFGSFGSSRGGVDLPGFRVGHSPEPGSLIVWGIGLLGAMGCCFWRRRRLTSAATTACKQ